MFQLRFATYCSSLTTNFVFDMRTEELALNFNVLQGPIPPQFGGMDSIRE